MYRTARVYVADMLDSVVVEATVFTADWRNEQPAQANTFSVTFPGVGEPNEHEWLRDALVALAETL